MNLELLKTYKYYREQYISYPFDINIAIVQLINVHYEPAKVAHGIMKLMKPSETYYRFKIIKNINYIGRHEFELTKTECEAYISEIPKYINTIEDLYEC